MCRGFRHPDPTGAGRRRGSHYFGLFALQHRGQEAAGIAVSERGNLTVLREMGLVAHVFDEQQLQALPGEAAIGHTRYSTTGANKWANAQPLIHHGRARTVALGHNGNLVNVEELRAELIEDGVKLASGLDSEVIAALVASRRRALAEAIAGDDARLQGAYSVTALVEGTLVAFRDPFGFRPLTLGRIGDDWVVASETCALDLDRRGRVRDVRRARSCGWTRTDSTPRRPFPPGGSALCIFEHVYFARPDSRVGGVEVHGARVRMGERLAQEAPVESGPRHRRRRLAARPPRSASRRPRGSRTTRRSSRTATSPARSSSPSRGCGSRASG